LPVRGVEGGGSVNPDTALSFSRKLRGDVHHQLDLLPPLLFDQQVGFPHRGEAALMAERQFFSVKETSVVGIRINFFTETGSRRESCRHILTSASEAGNAGSGPVASRIDFLRRQCGNSFGQSNGDRRDEIIHEARENKDQ